MVKLTDFFNKERHLPWTWRHQMAGDLFTLNQRVERLEAPQQVKTHYASDREALILSRLKGLDLAIETLSQNQDLFVQRLGDFSERVSQLEKKPKIAPKKHAKTKAKKRK
jgi:hypothetical protein